MKIKIKKKMPVSVSIKTTQVQPELEDLEVTPTTEEQNFKSSKYGYDNVKVKAVEGESLEINPSIEKQNFKGLYDEITVNEVTSNIDEDIKAENIKAGVNILGVNGSYEGVDTSDATATSGDILKDKTAYINNEKVIGTIESYDGSYSGNVAEGIKITDASYLFYMGKRINMLNEILSLCDDVTSCYNMFGSSSSLTELDLSNFNTSKVTDMSSMFNTCYRLTELNLSNFNTSNVTNISNMFSSCNDLTNLDLSNFDLSKVNKISNMFSSCTSLTNLKSFKNLGKGYTNESNNYAHYKLNLSSCTNLIHESLMSVINNLYDLNLTYDVANGGTLYRQSLVLGSTNLAKLQATEEGQLALSEADRKGWNVT